MKNQNDLGFFKYILQALILVTIIALIMKL